MEQREINPEYQKWVCKLMGFNFEIQYRPGRANTVVDAFPRKGAEGVEQGTLLAPSSEKWAEFEEVIKGDSFMSQLTADITTWNREPKGFHVDQGILKFKGRLVIPNNTQLVQALQQEYHDSPWGGHSKDLKTYKRIAVEWFWPGMRKTIAQYV